MRAISLVNRLEFDFSGNVLRNAIALKDVDNDGDYELIIGSERGEVTIFKGYEKWQTITNLGFVCCVAISDIFNRGKNCLVIVTGDGWCYIYAVPDTNFKFEANKEQSVDAVDGQMLSSENYETQSTDSSSINNTTREKHNKYLQRVHVQRIPANAKYIVLDDVDGDGCIEMVLGLTDRVVRSYRWVEQHTTNKNKSKASREVNNELVCLNKWECAKQIGSVSLHRNRDDKPSLLIAQPGGTFMRISFHNEEESLETSDSNSSNSDYLMGSSIDYQFLGLSRMRNQNISTEIVGDLKTADNRKGAPYAVATLDGSLMLVEDETILWAIAVDHQIFALTKLDITRDGVDELVACSWDGHTYILDQHKHVVRFQMGESVQAFDCGYYTLEKGGDALRTFVYVTFHNKIYVYYDIPLNDMVCKKFVSNLDEICCLLNGESDEDRRQCADNLSEKQRKELVEYILYGCH